MNASLLRAIAPNACGLGLPTLFVVLPAFAVVACYPFVFVSNLLSENWPHLVLGIWLVCALGLAYVIWLVAVWRGGVTQATGTGFVVAGYAVLQRVYCEFLLSYFGEAPHLVHPGSGFTEVVRFTRNLGWVGLVFGLACVVAACLAERRLRRTAPDWAMPP